jgi:hypothetical protein
MNMYVYLNKYTSFNCLNRNVHFWWRLIKSRECFKKNFTTLKAYRRIWSQVRTDGPSVSMSRRRAHSGTCDQILHSVRGLLSESCSVGHPLWREVGSVTCDSQSVVIYQYVHEVFTCHVFYISAMYMQCLQSLFQSRLGTADYALQVTIINLFSGYVQCFVLS